MKRIFAAAAIIGLLAGVAYALPTTLPGQGVRGSVHDMNNLVAAPGIGTFTADSQGRVCSFCHTPHHGLQDVNFDYVPLWAHQFTALVPGSGYTGYASPTFLKGQSATVDPLYGPSRLCMSCHDGVVAPDQHYGIAGNPPSGLMATDTFGGKAIGLGGNFTNDHPIGFDVVPVVTAGGFYQDTGIDPSIITVKTWQGNITNPTLTVKSTLYDPTGTSATLYMTCATCHDVHNRNNAPNTIDWNGDGQGEHLDTVHGNFLVFGPQSGSQLCLTCHLK